MSLGFQLLALAVYVLAVMRLTRLVNADTIFDPMRIAVARRYGPASTLVEFLACPWCVGMWFALLLAIPAVSFLGWPWWTVVPLGLACSQIVGMFAPLSSDDDIEYETVEGD